MSSASRASLIIAASMGAVEALKDQAGLCRWNYALRSLQQRAKSSNVVSLSQATATSTARTTSSSVETRMRGGKQGRRLDDGDEKAKRTEESLRTVMYLSCWGPY